VLGMISYEQGLAIPIAYALETLFSNRFHHVFQQKIVGQEKRGIPYRVNFFFA
jgi:hypothetical protein